MTSDGHFEVGDLVVANEHAGGRYSITKPGWEGEVTRIDKEYKTLSGDTDKEVIWVDGKGNSFRVSPYCFDLQDLSASKGKGVFIANVTLPMCCGECFAFDDNGCKFIHTDPSSEEVWKSRATNCPMRKRR